MRHELKTWPKPFRAVIDGNKRYEIRVTDRDYRVGDELLLREWVPDVKWRSTKYTGSFVLVVVTYMTKGGEWGLPDNLCVMSISKPGKIAEVTNEK